jgi:hypothetical protein
MWNLLELTMSLSQKKSIKLTHSLNFAEYKLFVMDSLVVLVSRDLDIRSLQKCLVDFNCRYIPLDDNPPRVGFPVKVFTFYKHYFVARVGDRELKCNYNCRNRVMSFPLGYPSLSREEKQELENRNYGLDLIDGMLHNTQLPHLIFTNGRAWRSPYDTNTIMENYKTLDIQKFAEITKSKPCNQNFFLVYLGPRNIDSRWNTSFRFMFCNMKTLETYEYSHEIRSFVEKSLLEDPDTCIAKWKAEDEALQLKQYTEKTPDFRLLDIEGSPVEENTDYYIGLYDLPEALLKVNRYSKIYLNIYTPYRLKHAHKMVVRYTVIDGIHYLTHENRFLQGYVQKVGLVDQLPEKDMRLEFHVTENNTFKTVQWNKSIWLTLQKHTVNNSSIEFDHQEVTIRWGTPLELFLKRA